MQILSGHKGCVRDVSWHPYNQEILSSSWDYTVRRWVRGETAGEKNSRSGEKEAEGRTEKKRRLDLEDL